MWFIVSKKKQLASLVTCSPATRQGDFPSITSQQEVSVLENVVNHPPLVDDIEDAWTVDMLTKEFVESTDKDRLQNSPEGADYPIYGERTSTSSSTIILTRRAWTAPSTGVED